jgi:hypothetical protein
MVIGKLYFVNDRGVTPFFSSSKFGGCIGLISVRRLQFRNGWGVAWMAVRVDGAGRLAVRCNARSAWRPPYPG